MRSLGAWGAGKGQLRCSGMPGGGGGAVDLQVPARQVKRGGVICIKGVRYMGKLESYVKRGTQLKEI